MGNKNKCVIMKVSVCKDPYKGCKFFEIGSNQKHCFYGMMTDLFCVCTSAEATEDANNEED